MANDLIKQFLHLRKWAVSHKGFSAAILAGIVASGVIGGVGFWEHGGISNIEARSASVAFQTSVTGITTNANLTPLDVNGNYYNTFNISQYKSVSYGSGSSNSTLLLNISNILPGDYVEFQITIKNTGGATFLLNATGNNYSINDAAYNSSTGAYVPPSENVTGPMNGMNSTPVSVGPYTFGMNFGNLQGMNTSDFESSLVGQSYWAMDWGASTPNIPHSLTHGAVFTYYIWVGLGTNAQYPPTEAVFVLNIPMVPAR